MREYKMYQYPRGVNEGGGTQYRYMPYNFLLFLAEQLLFNRDRI